MRPHQDQRKSIFMALAAATTAEAVNLSIANTSLRTPDSSIKFRFAAMILGPVHVTNVSVLVMSSESCSPHYPGCALVRAEGRRRVPEQLDRADLVALLGQWCQVEPHPGSADVIHDPLADLDRTVQQLPRFIAPALLAAHDKPITSLAYSPDGSKLASASFDQTVRLWAPE